MSIPTRVINAGDAGHDQFILAALMTALVKRLGGKVEITSEEFINVFGQGLKIHHEPNAEWTISAVNEDERPDTMGGLPLATGMIQ